MGQGGGYLYKPRYREPPFICITLDTKPTCHSETVKYITAQLVASSKKDLNSVEEGGEYKGQ